MGRLMHDSYGIGLAATQVGVMHRLLVYRTELEGTVAALVNPVLEWASKDKETSEEGCLSLPGVGVDVERPVHVRVCALDEYGKPILVEASGLEARVIQHEMDHLDGVLILDRTSRDQRKQAMRTLREQLEPHGRLRNVYLGTTRLRGGRPAARSPTPRTARSSSSRGPDAKQGRGQKLAPPPVAVLAAELGIQFIQPDGPARGGDAAGDRGRAARGAHHLRVRRADQGAAAQRLRDDQRAPVAAAALARGGADRARDHGRRRRDRRGDHARHRGLGLRRRSTRSAASRSTPTTTTARSRRGWSDARRRACWCEVLDDAPDAGRAGRVQGHLRAQDRPARARAGPDADAASRSSARSARCARTSARGCRCPTARSSGVIDARVDGPTLAPAGGLRAHGRAAAAAGLQRRRARADARSSRPAGKRHARRRLAARPARREAHQLPLRPRAARPLARGDPRDRPARVARPGGRVAAARVRAHRPRRTRRRSRR